MDEAHVPASPPHILHVIVGLARGGAETSLRHLITHSDGRLDHTVFCFGKLGDLGAEMVAQGLTVYQFGLSLPGILKARQKVTELRPDVLQGWMYYGNVLASVLATTEPVAWNYRSAFADGSQMNSGARAAMDLGRWMHPDTLIFNSHAGQDCHQPWLPTHRTQRVIENGVLLPSEPVCERVSRRRKLLEQYTTAASAELAERPWVGLLSRYHPDKGVAHFVAAAQAMGAHERRPLFVLAGRDMPQHVEAVDGQLLVFDQVDSAVWLPAFDVLAVASRREGAPNVLLEAMAHGVAGVGTDCGDVTRILDDAARVCAVDDSSGLVQVIEHALADAETYGQRDRMRVSEHYSLSRCIDAYVDCYTQMLEPRTS